MYDRRRVQSNVFVVENNQRLKIQRNGVGKFPCKCGALFKKPQSFQIHWRKCAGQIIQSEPTASAVDESDIQLDTPSHASNATVLDELGLIVNNAYGAIFCRICKCLVKKASLHTHLYRVHKIENAKAKLQLLELHLPIETSQVLIEPNSEGINAIEGN